MYDYDPAKSPNRNQWLAMEEPDRINLVRQYHETTSDSIENPTAHYGLNVTVETQIALDTPLVRQALGRLRKQGLSRHDGIHAIGNVVAKHMQNLIRSQYDPARDPNDYYGEMLSELGVSDSRADS